MAIDLAYGRRVYDWWGRRERTYRFFIALVLLGRERRLRDAAIKHLRLEQGAKVLDLACGPGINFPLLERAVGPSGSLTALDYSARMLESAASTAQAAGWQNIEFVQGDAAKMALPTGSLDGALCTMALSAIPDHVAAIRNVRAALKPGARFAVFDARPLRGIWRIFNPTIRPLFRYTTNWDPDKDIIGTLRAQFGAVHVETFNAGSIYLAIANKRQSA